MRHGGQRKRIARIYGSKREEYMHGGMGYGRQRGSNNEQKKHKKLCQKRRSRERKRESDDDDEPHMSTKYRFAFLCRESLVKRVSYTSQQEVTTSI